MSLLWRLIFSSRCTSTHHKLALDALRFVRGPQSDLWANLFLANCEQYLTGSKAPDNEFKDFKNHVLHVEDGFWGGATVSARHWYQKTVASLSQGDWPEAIYNAGVLSHYFTDPFQPFHTGQTEEEGKVHRPAEWSIFKSYDELQAILEHDLTGYPEWEMTDRTDWLEEAIRQGAIAAHQSYDVCVDHYDLSRGIKNPPSGLDQEMKDRLARLIGMAVIGFARVLERAFEESGSSPPDVAVSLHVFLATLKVPINYVTRKLTDIHDRAIVEAIYLEVQEKGKVIDALPEDERLVRKLYAQEVLKVPVRQLDAQPAKATGTQYGTGTPSRGETTKAVSPATYQRTVVSAPHWVDAPRGAAVPLETCLMVPLAAAAPVDYVKESAVRAYLGQSAPPLGGPGNPSFSSDGGVGGQPLPSTMPEMQPSALKLAAETRPTIAGPAPPSKSDLDKQERRLQKQLQRPADIEPTIKPPTLPVSMVNSLSSSLATPEAPADMFGPLPAMPRVPQRERVATGADSVQAAADIVPQPMAVKTAPAVPASEPPARMPQPVVVPQMQAVNRQSQESKTYQAQPAAKSVVPAPHVRLPEPSADELAASENIERVKQSGQTDGFDFRMFSGIQSPHAPAPIPAPAPARSSPPPIRQAAVEPTFSPSPTERRPAAKLESRRFYLELNNPVVDAPSIGPKTADRLATIGVKTVGDLLQVDAQQAAAKLGNPAAQAVIREWQAQATLVCRVPNLRGHDAQFLVACQVLTAEQLCGCDPRQLLQQVQTFVNTTVGQRLLRGGSAPDLAEVTEWIVAGRDSRTLT
ncbi:MAG: hypothetical protein JWN70_3052 [Planctomycetaceae bacterium]|nr:hypothetical protein [Planctomycetaceae bacterium]